MKRFPVVLSVACAVAVALLIGLGVWQLQRLTWKQGLLARIAALQTAAPRPLGPVLARGARGADVAFTRVSTSCAPAPDPAVATYRYALREGRVAWRLLSVCRLIGAPYPAIVLDRGVARRFDGAMAPGAASYAATTRAVGILREPGAPSFLDAPTHRGSGGVLALQALNRPALRTLATEAGASRAAPYYLAVESETPGDPGLAPSALPEDIPNNHFVYALTWFGLAAGLGGVWAGMVWKRMRGR